MFLEVDVLEVLDIFRLEFVFRELIECESDEFVGFLERDLG